MTQLVWPNGSMTTEPVVSDAWGYRGRIPGLNTRPWHTGQDWHSIGTLRAIGDGTVIEAGNSGWAGWYVLIYLGEIDGVRTWVRYSHLKNPSHLNRGDQVRAGDPVGIEGNTGVAGGVHLHLEIYRGQVDRGDGDGPAATVDPRAFIRARLSNIQKILEDSMANPIISVPDSNGTLYIGCNDGTFVEYETPKAQNSRAIISKGFLGGPGGNADTIPAFSWVDFKVIKTVWWQMCTGK